MRYHLQSSASPWHWEPRGWQQYCGRGVSPNPNPANVQDGFGIFPGSYALGLFLQPFHDSGATEYLSINPFLLKLTREWIPAFARQNPDQ